MHEAEILEPAEVDHLGELVACYLVYDKALGAKLDKMGQVISLVMAIADSQKQLDVSITTPAPRNGAQRPRAAFMP